MAASRFIRWWQGITGDDPAAQSPASPPGRSGSWSEATVGDHCCEVFEPDQRNDADFVLVYLHASKPQSLRGQTAFEQAFARHGLPVVAPVTGRSWWTDRLSPAFESELTAERHVLERVLPFVQQQLNASPPQIGLLGVEMGGQGALRLAYKFPRTFPVVAAIAPVIDFQECFKQGDEILRQMYPDAEAVRQDTATLYATSLKRPSHQFFCCDPTDPLQRDGAERLQMKLASLGVPHECDLESTAATADRYQQQMADRAVAFLFAGLEQVSRAV